MQHLVCADIGIELDRQENLICVAEDWSAETAAQGIVFPAPPWLDLQAIDVRDVALK